MGPRRAVVGRILCPLVLLFLVSAACSNGTSTSPSSASPTGSEAGLISQFPADVQPLLKGLPQEVIGSLLKVRKEGANNLVFRMSAGELLDAMNRAYRDNWEKITGWKVVSAGDFPGPAEVEQQAKSGHSDWDIVEQDVISAAKLEGEGLLEKLDTSVLQSFLSKMPAAYPHTDYWLTYTQAAVVLVYRTDTFKDVHPTSVLDLFDTAKFPGKRCMFGYPEFGGTVEYALLADGVPRDQLYPLDVNRALAKLQTIKKDLIFWGTGGEAIQKIINGDCDLGYVWNGRPAIRLRQDSTLPIAAVWGTSAAPTILTPGALMIPKSAAHYDAAMSLFAYGWQPKNQCNLLNDIGYGVPLDESCLNDFARTWSVSGDHLQNSFNESPDYYKANIGSLVDQFNAWLTSK
jgi:putative spermidine/putrescine transport system substrate-binding protein